MNIISSQGRRLLRRAEVPTQPVRERVRRRRLRPPRGLRRAQPPSAVQVSQRLHRGRLSGMLRLWYVSLIVNII